MKSLLCLFLCFYPSLAQEPSTGEGVVLLRHLAKNVPQLINNSVQRKNMKLPEIIDKFFGRGLLGNLVYTGAGVEQEDEMLERGELLLSSDTLALPSDWTTTRSPESDESKESKSSDSEDKSKDDSSDSDSSSEEEPEFKPLLANRGNLAQVNALGRIQPSFSPGTGGVPLNLPSNFAWNPVGMDLAALSWLANNQHELNAFMNPLVQGTAGNSQIPPASTIPRFPQTSFNAPQPVLTNAQQAFQNQFLLAPPQMIKSQGSNVLFSTQQRQPVRLSPRVNFAPAQRSFQQPRIQNFPQPPQISQFSAGNNGQFSQFQQQNAQLPVPNSQFSVQNSQFGRQFGSPSAQLSSQTSQFGSHGQHSQTSQFGTQFGSVGNQFSAQNSQFASPQISQFGQNSRQASLRNAQVTTLNGQVRTAAQPKPLPPAQIDTILRMLRQHDLNQALIQQIIKQYQSQPQPEPATNPNGRLAQQAQLTINRFIHH